MDLLCCSGHRDWLDLGGAEFVFRDLADRVELGVGQHIGGGFGIAERDEHLPPGATALSLRAFSSMARRRVVTRICSPAAIPRRRSSA
jgi:hypothetical protein